MNHAGLAVAFALYFGSNFLCALVLHVHADHQAHLRLRLMDVLVHFVLLTAFALPVLLFITAGALFGGRTQGGSRGIASPRVHAA